MRAGVAALAVFLACACARPPAPVVSAPDLSPLVLADARVERGCYDCLLEARAIYERVGAAAGRQVVVAALFETEILIALREKELAMLTAAAASVARARAIAAELPPEARGERYLSLVDLVVPDNIGTPRAELARVRRAPAERLAALDGELAWLRTSTTLREPARQYLSLAIDCSYLTRSRRLASLAPEAGRWTGSRLVLQAKEDVAPLVAYRAAICDAIGTRTLERVRTTVPQFAEAAFFLARPALQQSASVGGGRARALLDEALARFPDSPSIAYLAGNLSQLVGDCRRALELYDRTLAAAPAHEDALLGRTMCLTFLGRPDEAIAQATRMIELETDNRNEALYWRAYNHHSREHLPPARADIDRAKPQAGQHVARFFTLAGMIEHDQDDLAIAEADLRRALAASDATCIAWWYLGMVKLKQAQPLESGGHFSSAMDCYAAQAANDERFLREMQTRPDLEPEFRARQIAAFEAALKEDRHQQYAAAFNGANMYAQGGNFEKARALVDIAASEPSLAPKVAQLRDLLRQR